MKRILIVKIGAIGDVVMALPLITEIRAKESNARITWICGKQVQPLLDRVEGIDELLGVDEKMLLKAGFFSRILEVLRFWTKILFRKFDLQLYFYHSKLYKILCLPAIIRETRGFGNAKKSAFSKLPVPGRHHSVEYIRAYLEPEGPDAIRPRYPAFRSLPERRPGDSRKIVLACGGARNILRNDGLRRWPIDQYAMLGSKIVNNGWELVLTGSAEDDWVKNAFSGIPFTDMIGKLGLTDFIDFLTQADLLVTHDSGPLHLADLAGCPVLGLFGPTSPEEKKSLHPASGYIWGGSHLSCRPCYDGKDYGKCRSNECLKSIDPDEVFHRVIQTLSI